MKTYPISCEISGPTAMWTRLDTGDAPVSYLAPTYSAAKGVLESVCWLKSAVVNPTRVEICAPPIWHTYTTNYGGPLRKSSSVKDGNSFQLLASVLVNLTNTFRSRDFTFQNPRTVIGQLRQRLDLGGYFVRRGWRRHFLSNRISRAIKFEQPASNLRPSESLG